MKTIISFGKWLGDKKAFYEITKKDQILAFLDTRIKNTEIDADKRWITTWNDYLAIYKDESWK